VDSLLNRLKIKDFTWRSAESKPSWAHPAKALIATCEGKEENPLAVVAALDPGLHAGLGLDGDLASDVAAAEISLDAILEAPRHSSHYEPVPRYPGIKVDVAIALAEDTPASAVEQIIAKAAKNQLADIELFDLYRGENLGAHRKSLAYHVLLQSDNKTLSDKDEQKFLRRFEQMIGEIGGELRRG
jgi:phenylalanyl-tRNA synthetase beta chain